jgi:hypothetical protein
MSCFQCLKVLIRDLIVCFEFRMTRGTLPWRPAVGAGPPLAIAVPDAYDPS